MKTTLLFDFMCMLNAESIKVRTQYGEAIDRFARDAAHHSPGKAAELRAVAKRWRDINALLHAEALRVLENGGKAMAPNEDLLSMFVGSMLNNLDGVPANVLGAAKLSGRYLGGDDVRNLSRQIQGEIVRALLGPKPPLQSQGEMDPRAA